MPDHGCHAVEAFGREVSRLVKTTVKTGLVSQVLRGHPVEALRVMVRHGLDARSIHRLYAALYPDRVALVDTDRRLTYAETDRRIEHLVRALRHRFRVESGTPVVLMMENRVEYVLGWFALFRIGGTGVHVSYRAADDELAYHVEHSGARVVLCSETSRETVEKVREERPELDLALIDVDADDHEPGVSSFLRLLEAGERMERHLDREELDEDGGSENIVYTSGTTGRPKAAVRDFTSRGVLDLARIIERLPVRAGDRHLVVSPMYHSGGQVFTLLNAALGATIHLRPEFEPEETLQVLADQRINSVFLVPTMLRRILALPDDMLERHPTPELRVVISGAAPFPERLRRRAIRRFGAGTVHDFYGATELGWVTLIDGYEMLERPGSVGRPIAGQEVRIVDDDGQECEPGEVGTIWVRSEHTMQGYLDEERVDETFRKEDWITVDDLGYVDGEGYLYLAGRSRDMIISGGVNIYPVEIEDTLAENEGVAEAGVIGVDDEEWGERVVAFVVPAGQSLEVEALESWLRERLAAYKVPKAWCVVDELPRNATGKILKNELEARFDEQS